MIFSKNVFLTLGLVLALPVFANEGRGQQSVRVADDILPLASTDLELWIDDQYEASWEKLLDNVSSEGTARGTVIASPSRNDPDYFYHWVRDAALVMRTIWSENGGHSYLNHQSIQEKMSDYLSFVKIIQPKKALSGLGEPKYHVDGRPFSGPWGRPQNDGPALRATVFANWAEQMIAQGNVEFVRKNLYAPKLPASTPIKRDLEYVSHNWTGTNFDLWEEVYGDHFYTRMVQLRGLRKGAQIAARMGDDLAAQWYTDQAERVGWALGQHFDPNRGYIVSTINTHRSGINVDAILAINHTKDDKDPIISYANPWVLSTVTNIENAFERVYEINKKGLPAVAIGRYPEDVYYGGNPWFLATHAMAEFHHNLATELAKFDLIEVTGLSQKFWRKLGVEVSAGQGIEINKNLIQLLKNRGDEYLMRSRVHVDADHRMAEQFERGNGFQLGARDLTWSYASFISAVKSR